MAVDQSPCCRGAPPSVTNLCGGPSVTNPCRGPLLEYCSLQGACRGGVCRRTPPSVANLCREMAAQTCHKANVFDSLPYHGFGFYTCTTKLHQGVLGINSMSLTSSRMRRQ